MQTILEFVLFHKKTKELVQHLIQQLDCVGDSI
ncbi:hypothetical protein HmCmsJML284_01258 [Escherichia coli]|uniref:Uncharacterized protein n=1 Tax=Escherichia coli TaxID=562 RepID=A0A4C7ASG5_ECOLX|nr:hypothetical protein HmCmsJML131_02714 [Escherichia coli]GDE55578.1 hypothetical protein HmCmsJML284_01258 [Escherichia coli]